MQAPKENHPKQEEKKKKTSLKLVAIGKGNNDKLIRSYFEKK